MPPLPDHGMERCGVDNLHLSFLNIFKHLFKYTVHEGLPETKKKIVKAYCIKAGFYSYDAASMDEDPLKHWIGREVKAFLQEAHLHLPFLLHVAAAPPDLTAEMAASLNVEGEMEMDDDDEYTPTEEEIAEEEAEEPLMMQNAACWDHFLDYVRAISAPCPQGEADTDEYRKGRALEAFNLGAAVACDLIALKPTMLSWVPHVMVFIVPRQMLFLGDPSRRSCDACESFGAMLKKIIKHTTCRRRLYKGEATEHKKKQGGSRKTWKQTFKRGYIEQAFRRAGVREALRHGTENAPYLQRIDAQRAATGKAWATMKVDKEEEANPTIYEACEAHGKQ